MSSVIRMGLVIGALIAAVVGISSTFVVQQTQQALVFVFGKVSRPPITQGISTISDSILASSAVFAS